MRQEMVNVQRPSRNRFKEEPAANIGRSQFDRSHGLKTTFDASYLVPIMVDEVLPGDTFTCRLNGFVRIFSPLDAPMMDNIECETFFFFVPTRLLWDNWAAFNGEHDAAGAQDTTFTIPVLGTGLTVDHDHQHGSNVVDFLAAYMGLPDGLQTAQVTGVNALPFRAYVQIYNEWFKDQNLIADRVEQRGNGPDTIGDFKLEKSAKKHDYFTSCLPYLQKGTAQTVSLSGSPKVTGNLTTGSDVAIWGVVQGDYHKLDSGAAQVDVSASTGTAGTALYVDLSTQGTIDVNALRQSVAIQRLLERDARGGTRYTEIIKSHFGVTSPDFRLQRPEYLGGGKSFVTVSPVANTSATASQDQGELRGVGSGVINGHGWAKSFTEHGYIIGIIRARGDVTYFQGMERLWSRSTRYDFYIPALANLGEQGVLNKEIFVSNVTATDDAVFGYQERWAEYRHKPSRLAGNFNPDITGSLSFWHLAEDFASLPVLNTSFIQDATPMTRVTTVTSEPDFIADIWFDYKCARPIPVRSIPSLMGGKF